jgi:hypothetical protein
MGAAAACEGLKGGGGLRSGAATGRGEGTASGRGGDPITLGRGAGSGVLTSEVEALATSRDIWSWLALSWATLALSCSISCRALARSCAIDCNCAASGDEAAAAGTTLSGVVCDTAAGCDGAVVSLDA